MKDIGTTARTASTFSMPQQVLVFILVCGLGMISIATRELFDLASIWLPNPVLLGLFILCPGFNRASNWLAAAAGFIVADLVWSTPAALSMMLTAANLSGVVAGVLTARIGKIRFWRPYSPVHAMQAIIVMLAAAGAAAAFGLVPGIVFFGLSVPESLLLWFTSELLGYAVILPLLLVANAAWGSTELSNVQSSAVHRAASLALLAMLIIVAHLGGHVGALSFTIPGLILCAFTFRATQAMVIVSLTCIWLSIAGPYGLLPLHADLNEIAHAASLRFGVSMLMFSGFAIVLLKSAWSRTHERLVEAATRDPMTGLYNRATFLAMAEQALAASRMGPTRDVLMIDIDHFKSVNDNYGHAIGDAVIVEVGAMFRAILREGDVVGRIGGEEFAVVLQPGTSGAATAIRLMQAARAIRVSGPDGEQVRVTISIGIASAAAAETIHHVFVLADHALYEAKRQGRDRMVAYPAAA